MTKSYCLRGAKTLVVKVGSALVTNEGRGLDAEALGLWAQQISQLMDLGLNIVLVSSGAIAEGMVRLGWEKRPSTIHELQAAAAIGQMGLVQVYESCFRRYGVSTAQILLTHADFSNRTRYLNARSTLRTLLSLKVVPIINENDTVATEEIKFGDNDTLAALVTNLLEADALVILTDQRGLFTADPRIDSTATLLSTVEAGDPILERMAGGAGSAISRGGMMTKVRAAARAASSGASTVIASGVEPNVLVRLVQGESIGTYFYSNSIPLAARKAWLTDHIQIGGRLSLDSGAVTALLKEGKSLLPVGIVAVEGDFLRGAVVACIDQSGCEVARGLVNYSASEAKLIMRRPSSDIENILGWVDEPELIHRDNLVLM